jgi:hypothetical protein
MILDAKLAILRAADFCRALPAKHLAKRQLLLPAIAAAV